MHANFEEKEFFDREYILYSIVYELFLLLVI